MRIKLIAVFALLANVALAQDFEGSIAWAIKMEITDPQMKAQMKEAEAQLKDPAVQAQMKQLMEQMNNPEMKKMMESNPQMKAQMESAMKMMQGGNLNSLVPTGMILKVKDGNTLTKMEGGPGAGMETLTLKAKKESYLINRESKTYTPLSHATEKPERAPQVTVKKTTETQKILSYTCTKVLVTVTENGQTHNQIFWTTNQIKGLDSKSLEDYNIGKTEAAYYKELDGFPLKMEMTTPQGTMVMEATEVKRQSLPAAEFQIPTGFTENKLPGQR